MVEWILKFGWDRLSSAKAEVGNQHELYKRVNVSFLTCDLVIRSACVGTFSRRSYMF